MKRILTAALLFICLFGGCTKEAKTDKEIFSSNDMEISHTGNASVTREIFAMDTYMRLTAYVTRQSARSKDWMPFCLWEMKKVSFTD